jgi:threonine dehydrogenase-like Zn-dependent dehydrogenase
MKALVLEDYKKFAFREAQQPQLESGRDVLVRVKAVGICGSDVHGMDGSTGRRRPPVIMGHEASGVIEAVGPGVTAWKPGDRVTFDSTIWCGECAYCRSGRVNLCDNRRVLGVSCEEYRQEGAFAEYVVVPDRILYRIPEALDFVGAALTEPVAVAAHAAALTPVQRNETLVVVGAGLIGLLLIQVLRSGHSGRILAVDLDPSRLEQARALGADDARLAGDPDLAAWVKDQTGGQGAHRAFEAVGATAPVKTAVSLVRKGGSVTLIGNLSPQIELPLQAVVTRELTLYGSCAIAGEYPLALDLMARGKINPRSVISAVRPLSEGASWFERLYAREAGLLKVVLEP